MLLFEREGERKRPLAVVHKKGNNWFPFIFSNYGGFKFQLLHPCESKEDALIW